MTDRTTEEARKAMLIRAAELLRQEATAIKDCHTLEGDWAGECEAKSAHDEMLNVAAALQWQAEQQKGEALPKIASEVRIMLGSATELFDGIGDIVGYQIKTGALHRILGLLSGAGHPVAIAAKNQSVAVAASPHGVPPDLRDFLLEVVCLTDRPDLQLQASAMLSSLPQAPQGEQE